MISIITGLELRYNRGELTVAGAGAADMSHRKLQNELKKLRREINNVTGENAAVRARLNQLISAIEKKINEPENADHHRDLVRGLDDAIRQFESEHPRATAILNDIMVTLSNMGI